MLEHLLSATLATLAALVNNEDALRHERAAGCGKNRQRARVQGTRTTGFERAPVRHEKHDEGKEGPLCA